MDSKRGWIVDDKNIVIGFYVHILHRVCKDYECKVKDHVLIKYYKNDEDAIREDLIGLKTVYQIVPIEKIFFREEPS